MFPGFMKAVCNGIQIADPNPYPLKSINLIWSDPGLLLPRYNAGNQPSHFRSEPFLSDAIYDGVDEDEAETVTDSD